MPSETNWGAKRNHYNPHSTSIAHLAILLLVVVVSPRVVEFQSFGTPICFEVNSEADGFSRFPAGFFTQLR